MNRKLWTNPPEVAVSLGICAKTLRRWGKAEKPFASHVHTNPRRKKALPMLVSKSQQEERAA